jgi:hypothetical protein
MNHFDSDTASYPPQRSNPIFKYLLIILSILLGLLCLAGFIVTSIQWNINSTLERNCTRNHTQDFALCYIRAIIHDGFRTQWNRYILVSLLLTYASVFLHMIVESSRTNVSGLLGQMIIQIICIIFGIGVCFPILFLSSYIYFYKFERHSTKSSVPIDIIFLAFIYIICLIIIPTYLIYFFSSNELILSIMSIILLISPLAFVLISLPFRLLSRRMQDCWIINSHRLIVYCQVALFCISTPLFFITFVALIRNWSFDLFKQSYVTEILNTINPIAMIWSIDYTSLLLSLILFIIINEYLGQNNNIRVRSIIIKRFISYFIFGIIFVITPCLAFPLYVAWKEYQYLQPM